MKEDDKDVEFTIPIRRSDLGKFIASLLGQRQTIQREIYGCFDVDHGWILKLVDMLSLRVSSQNHGELVDFLCEITFENESSRTIHSIKELETFEEVKPYSTHAIQLRWSYLVRFPGAENPEKQEISITFDTTPPSSGYESIPYGKLLTPPVGRIEYSIGYTERTWGNDIDRLISDELDKVITRRRRIASLVVRAGLLLFSFIVSMAFVMTPLIVSFRASNVSVHFSGVRKQVPGRGGSGIEQVGWVEVRRQQLCEILFAGRLG